MDVEEEGSVTNMLGRETVGWSKLLDVIGIVSKCMDLVHSKIEWP